MWFLCLVLSDTGHRPICGRPQGISLTSLSSTRTSLINAEAPPKLSSYSCQLLPHPCWSQMHYRVLYLSVYPFYGILFSLIQGALKCHFQISGYEPHPTCSPPHDQACHAYQGLPRLPGRHMQKLLVSPCQDLWGMSFRHLMQSDASWCLLLQIL